MAVTISIEGIEAAREKLGLIMSPDTKKAVVEHVGVAVTEEVKDFLDNMAESRHKVADRLGASHLKYFEYASGRLGGTRKDGSIPGVEPKGATDSSVTISVKNTPGLKRAFGPMTITPKKARALTIPINRLSYGKSVREMTRGGSKIFPIKSKKGNSLLVESDGTEKGIRPLYVLVKKAVVPQDKGLLPSRDDFQKWALRAAKGKMREMSL